MPFGLKNAGATYQRVMNTIFHEHMRKPVKCYVDDIAVKSRTKGDHITDLKTIFEIMRAHQLKMNPTKSFLGVASGKFLGFVVTSTGIHLDPEKFALSRRCNLRGTSGSLGDYKDDWHTSEDLSQTSLEDANLLPN